MEVGIPVDYETGFCIGGKIPREVSVILESAQVSWKCTKCGCENWSFLFWMPIGDPECANLNQYGICSFMCLEGKCGNILAFLIRADYSNITPNGNELLKNDQDAKKLDEKRDEILIHQPGKDEEPLDELEFETLLLSKAKGYKNKPKAKGKASKMTVVESKKIISSPVQDNPLPVPVSTFREIFPRIPLDFELEEGDTGQAMDGFGGISSAHIDDLYRKYLQQESSGTEKDVETNAKESYERSEKEDFLKFQRKLLQYPDQCIRFQLGGSILWPSKKYERDSLSTCKDCGSALMFSLQIMPSALSLWAQDLSNPDILALIDQLPWSSCGFWICSQFSSESHSSLLISNCLTSPLEE